jgi:hypothetical protein
MIFYSILDFRTPKKGVQKYIIASISASFCLPVRTPPPGMGASTTLSLTFNEHSLTFNEHSLTFNEHSLTFKSLY